jgi:hypothetical protein
MPTTVLSTRNVIKKIGPDNIKRHMFLIVDGSQRAPAIIHAGEFDEFAVVDGGVHGFGKKVVRLYVVK